jgi:hypothetical protein
MVAGDNYDERRSYRLSLQLPKLHIAAEPNSTRNHDFGLMRSARASAGHGRQRRPARVPSRQSVQPHPDAARHGLDRGVGHDPRWPEHRRKLAAAQEARRMTLFDNEVAAIVTLRRKGRTFSYIAEEIGVCRDVIGRELRARGIATGHIKADRRARRGRGFWRCFD